MKRRNAGLILSAAACCLANFALAQNFLPDFQFEGSSLDGWHKVGAADWRAEDGVLIALPTPPDGGWLFLDKSYQDVAVAASFRGTGKAGLLLRGEKTEQGTKGVFVSLSPGDPASSYEVVLDAKGREVSRTPLTASRRPMIRSATMADHLGEESVPGFSTLPEAPARPSAAADAAGQGAPPRRGPGPTINENGWNTVEVILDADLISVTINGRRGGLPGVTYDQMMGFGSIAFYAGGEEVRFKDVSVRDLNPKVEPNETVSKNFRMHRLSDFYYGWCAAVGDINRDGVKDVVAGPFYYLGPDYTERREFTAARTYNPSAQFAQSMVNFTYDFTGDGWTDILVVDQRPIWLYVNPRGESRRWDRYKVIANASTELELFKDIDGDGKPEVLFAGDGMMAYAKPDPANPTAPWIIHPVSEKGRVNPHGMGVGDINGDGRMDIVNASGWWEQPLKDDPQHPWPFQPASFGRGGAEMGIYDVNGDGLNDVVTALSAHGWGLAWFEQKRDPQGKIAFVEHAIMGDFSTGNAGGVTFSEPHAANFADIDGDGVLDLVVGKRNFSHLDSYLDPDPYGAAVLYWYRTTRNPQAEGGAEFVPELIHNRSGVGSHFETIDINNDGSMDIVTSANRGTFIFWGSLGSATTSRRSN